MPSSVSHLRGTCEPPIHCGMIATGNHQHFNSLRGAPPQRGRLEKRIVTGGNPWNGSHQCCGTGSQWNRIMKSFLYVSKNVPGFPAQFLFYSLLSSASPARKISPAPMVSTTSPSRTFSRRYSVTSGRVSRKTAPGIFSATSAEEMPMVFRSRAA